MKKNIKKIDNSFSKKIYLYLFVLFIPSIFYIYYMAFQIKKELNDFLTNPLIILVKKTANDIENEIFKNVKNKNKYKKIQLDEKIRKKIKEIISYNLNSSYKQIYFYTADQRKVTLYEDIFNKNKKEKAILNKINQKKWINFYKNKKEVLSLEKGENIIITYHKPLFVDNKFIGILTINFLTKNFAENILKMINKEFIFIFIIFSILSLIFALQEYYSYRIKAKSYIDYLTNTFNRHFLRKFLDTNNINNYYIFMIDVDYFKKINDNYGHKAGDEILKKVVEVIKQHMKDEDVIFRYGGEEFLLFVKKRKTDKNLTFYKTADSIRRAIKNTEFLWENHLIKITISIGINKNPEQFKSVSEAIKYADKMLYIAKERGRNCVVCSKKYETKENDCNKKDKLSIVEIKNLIEKDRVVCFFHPIYDLKTLEIKKYEALVRLIGEDNEIIQPYYFINKIHKTTLYTQLTKKVIEIVFKNIEKTKNIISINLNFSDIMNNDVYDLLIKSFEKNKEYVSYFLIELLENENIKDIETMKERIEKIRSFGIKIALDDFGSGYSNYEIFKILPIDFIKIDGNLIKDLPSSNKSLKIIKSIVYFAKELNIGTIAEFIHSEEVFKTIKNLGVDYLQGYYFSPPMKNIGK